MPVESQVGAISNIILFSFDFVTEVLWETEAPAATIEDVMREVFPTVKHESEVNLRENRKDSALWSLAKGAPIGDFENRRVQSERDCIIVEPTNYVTEGMVKISYF